LSLSPSRPEPQAAAGRTESVVSHAQEKPELFIGLIGAVGTDTHRLTDHLRAPLARVGYGVEEIHAIDLPRRFFHWEAEPAPVPVNEYYHALMDAGNHFRARVESNAVMALLAMAAVREHRWEVKGCPQTPAPRTAYIIRSLKTPAEIAALREVYGKSFIAIAAYAPKDDRREYLRERVRRSHPGPVCEEEIDALVETVLRRDEAEPDNLFGQNLEATFPQADFFVEMGSANLERAIARIIELIFGNLFHTPTRDEYGMFHAVSAGVRSSSLARQVGAAICTREGELLALGCNEVPKAGGGLYWEGDENDSRDHVRGYDSNDQMKMRFLRDILCRLQSSGWLAPGLAGCGEEELLHEALQPGSTLRQAELMKVIEYGRSVHAEMAALMDATKRGISVQGCTLYTTTFPCHNCAKHIVASGVRRVVYVEPYPKSFTRELYSDSIWLDGQGIAHDEKTTVRFEPFVGISFRQYFSLFSMGNIERKSNGSRAEWQPRQATLRYHEHPSAYLARETEALGRFQELLRRAGIEPVEPRLREWLREIA